MLAHGYDRAPVDLLVNEYGGLVTKDELCHMLHPTSIDHLKRFMGLGTYLFSTGVTVRWLFANLAADDEARRFFFDTISRIQGFWREKGLVDQIKDRITRDSREASIIDRWRKISGATALGGAAIAAVSGIIIMVYRLLKATNTRTKTVERLVSEERHVLTQPPKGFQNVDICKDALKANTQTLFRRTLIREAQERGVRLKCRHFFTPQGELREEHDTCRMLLYIPSLPIR